MGRVNHLLDWQKEHTYLIKGAQYTGTLITIQNSILAFSFLQLRGSFRCNKVALLHLWCSAIS